jgi:hypothetical protein
MKFTDAKPGMKVIDRLWPERPGIVRAITSSRIIVRWSDGKEWRYDRPHCQFLEKAKCNIPTADVRNALDGQASSVGIPSATKSRT